MVLRHSDWPPLLVLLFALSFIPQSLQLEILHNETNLRVTYPDNTNATTNYTVTCTELNTCDLCASHIELGCGWCSIDSTCYNGSSSGSDFGNCSAGCWSFGGPESCSGSCWHATSCADCLTQTRCFWCASEQKCKLGTLDATSACGGCADPNTTITLSSPQFASNSAMLIADVETSSLCWKTDADMCPANGVCSSKQTCSECTADEGCAWCGASAKCVEVATANTSVGCGSCGSFGVTDCWKSTAVLCPTLPSSTKRCEDLVSCSSCTAANCFWCGTSSLCMEATASASPVSCGYHGEACANYTTGSCWKGPTVSSSTCPTLSSCSAAMTCSECISASCFWCGASQQCLEASGDGQSICSANSSIQCASCWKGADTAGSVCPIVPFCAQFADNCALCIGNGCGFCKSSGECAEIGADLQSCQGHKCDQWLTGSCEGVCESYGSDCEGCLSSPAKCGLCSGYSNGSMLVSMCVEALADGTGPQNGSYQCALWHNTSDSCPTCQGFSGNCFECAQQSHCGYCQLSSSQHLCIEGTATYSFEQDQCEFAGGIYNGTSCNPLPCPATATGPCNGKGTCNSTVGLCTCNSDWEGPACSCQLSVCNGGGGGQCTNGVCVCSPNYTGPYCQFFCDPAVTCNGNGACIPLGGGCNCTAPYYGATCASSCTNSGNCSGNGHCCAFSTDCSNSTDVCKCNLGWRGEQCAVLDCRNSTITECATCHSVMNASGSSMCGWCEDLNTCTAWNESNTCDSPLLSECGGSCTSLSQSSCLDGRHCDCVWCVSLDQCFAYNSTQSAAPNAPNCYMKYSCTSDPIGVSVPALLAICITGGVIMLIVLIWGAYFIFRAPNLYMQVPTDVPE